ncbi:hypothetical protein [Williamsia deligens]|uniref:Mce-associated membrane protein n=1 Tax=Williamsia deligens TaxID=321325 RepID=A0ABW3G3P1_9NOCA|nr:hypothetical protein [Williamsia deligens]MCP2194581.1 Mce-associated membrane protein [Williamsia deligens]
MTTPRGPRGNRRPRVAGRPSTRPTGPDRPSQGTPDAETPTTQTPEATPPPRPSTTKRPKKQPTPPAAEPAATAAAEASNPAPTGPDTPSTDPDTAKTDLTKAPAAPRGKSRPAVKVSTIKPQSTRPAPRPAQDGASAATRARRRIPGWRTVGVVAVIAAIVGAVAGVAAAEPGVTLSDNEAFVDPSVTSQVTAQAKSRICTVFGVNYAKLDDWERTAKQNVTGEAANRFTQYAGAVRDALGQTGLTEGGVDCRVDTVGVRDISGDQATLVTNLILSQTQGQQATGSGTKRYQVSMRHVSGQWLISNFADF